MHVYVNIYDTYIKLHEYTHCLSYANSHTHTNTHTHAQTIHVHLCEHIHTNTHTNTHIRARSLSLSFSRRLFPFYNVQAGGEYRKTPASLSKVIAASAIIIAFVSFALS